MTNKSIPNYYLYGETSPLGEPSYVHLESVHSRSSLYDWKIRAHRHDRLFQILVILEGGAEVYIDELKLHCDAPCVVTVPAREVHGFEFSDNTQGQIMTVDESFLLGLFDIKELKTLHGLLERASLIQMYASASATQEIVGLVEGIRNELVSPGLGAASLVGAYLKALLIILNRQHYHDELSEPSRPGRRKMFDRFRALLERHLSEHCSVKAYANKLDITVGQLNRICKTVTQLTPSVVIQRRMMVEARRLLIYTDMSISEVSYHLGFKDPAYFTRFFTRNQGVCPKQFCRDQLVR